MSEPRPLDRTRPLRGRDLRHAALVVLDRWGPASIGELIDSLARAGFRVGGSQPNKVLADALGHEVLRGRARRVGRGRYRIAQLASTTRWRLRRRFDQATGHADNQPEPPRPLTRRRPPGTSPRAMRRARIDGFHRERSQAFRQQLIDRHIRNGQPVPAWLAPP